MTDADQPVPAPTQRESNLCVLYGDHDECPFHEVQEDGSLLTCNCSCHLFPDSSLD